MTSNATGIPLPAVDENVMGDGRQVAAAVYAERDVRRRLHNAEVEVEDLQRELALAIRTRKRCVKEFKNGLPWSRWKRFWHWFNS